MYIRLSSKKYVWLGLISLFLSACSSLDKRPEPPSQTVKAEPETTRKAAPAAPNQAQSRKQNQSPAPDLAQTRAPITSQPGSSAQTSDLKTRTVAASEKPTTPPTAVPSDLWEPIRSGFRLPSFQSSRIQFYERKFSRHPRHVAQMMKRARWFIPSIYEEVKKRNLPTELVLLPAVESAFQTAARSRTGASGLWQFISSTGRLFGLPQNAIYDARRDPMLSTHAALDYLEQLNARFDGDWLLAIAGYNAGGRTIERAVKKNQRSGKPAEFHHLDLRRETRDYVPKLIAWRNIISDPRKYGLRLAPMPLDPQIARVTADTPVSIPLLAHKLNIPAATLRFLNSCYLHQVTPSSGQYDITVPAARQEFATTTLASLSPKERVAWIRHRVQPGEVLGRISKRYGISVAALRRHNHIRGHLIHPGQVLLIPAQSANSKLARGSDGITQKRSSDTRRVTHKIRRGDTLWEIARRYGVKVNDLSRWNNIRPAQTLRLGQQLVIYLNRPS